MKEIKNIINKLGIETTLTPNTQLRNSWYVEQLNELGYDTNKVNHLELSCGGFIAQLDDNLFCSGSNIYIVDALSSIAFDLGLETFYLDEYCNIYGEDEDWLITFTKEQFENFIKYISK